MKTIVDTNIIFSAVTNSQGKIGDLLLNSTKIFSFYAPHFLHFEIRKHRNKLKKISGLSDRQLEEAEYFIARRIEFISEEQIPKNIWKRSMALVSDIDPADVTFVALNDFLRGRLWTGDKKLIKGLRDKGYKRLLTTAELLDLRKRRESKK